MVSQKRQTERRGDNLYDDLDLFLGDLCFNYGICLWVGAKELCADSDQIGAMQLAKLILTAEGIDPVTSADIARSIRNDFIERYGTNKMSEVEYRR